jgi:hypothetical protein
VVENPVLHKEVGEAAGTTPQRTVEVVVAKEPEAIEV